MRITRRAFLGGLLATAACSGSGDDDAAPTTSSPTSGPSTTDPPTTDPPTTLVPVGPDPFTLGVASGDPEGDSVVLWTRLLPDGEPLTGDVPVRWEVLGDEEDDVITEGETVAEERWGHAVHVVADDLEPGTAYRYRFVANGHRSTIGRTRTAPPGDDDGAVRLAVASCQRYDDGHFAAHRDIAAADVDLVVFLGDYIYESPQRPDPVRPLPAGPDAVVDLAGYRSRYEAARRDADLAAAHAAHPWAVTWDDHEVVNDHAGTTVDPARRAAAYQAWWEHMPVRVAPPVDGSLSVRRALRWGSTLELLLLDTRQHRAAPPCGGGIVAASCAELADPTRSVLGAEQEDWLLDRLAGGDASWTALGSSVLLAPLDVLGQRNGDAWDGYPPARDRITEAMDGLDAVVLTGDLHVQLVVDVVAPVGDVVATELVAPSISSRVAGPLAELADLVGLVAPQIVHAGVERRGWLRCDVSPDRWVATYREVLDVLDPASRVVDGPGFEVLAGAPGAVRL